MVILISLTAMIPGPRFHATEDLALEEAELPVALMVALISSPGTGSIWFSWRN